MTNNSRRRQNDRVPQFTARVFYPGRRVRIRYGYGLAYPELPAIVTRFEMKPLAEIPLMHGLYGGMNLTDEIALIHLELSRQPAPVHYAARRPRRCSAARPRP
jgi:hypothetical protein